MDAAHTTAAMSKYEWERRDAGGQGPAAQGHDAGDFVAPDAESAAATEAPDAGEQGPAANERPRSVDQALDLIDRLHEEIAARTAELAEVKDQRLREHADLENYKRRMQREKSEALRYASEHLLRDLLPVIDNLERAVGAAVTAEASEGAAQAARIDGLVTGVKMVLQQFKETLGRFGVTRIESTGQSFDPNHHEAVAHVETDRQPPGAVVDEYASGYRLHERLLRPAQVTVAKAK